VPFGALAFAVMTRGMCWLFVHLVSVSVYGGSNAGPGPSHTPRWQGGVGLWRAVMGLLCMLPWVGNRCSWHTQCLPELSWSNVCAHAPHAEKLGSWIPGTCCCATGNCTCQVLHLSTPLPGFWWLQLLYACCSTLAVSSPGHTKAYHMHSLCLFVTGKAMHW
jgi:hypothetical protein